jgi:hypothetical protein
MAGRLRRPMLLPPWYTCETLAFRGPAESIKRHMLVISNLQERIIDMSAYFQTVILLARLADPRKNAKSVQLDSVCRDYRQLYFLRA